MWKTLALAATVLATAAALEFFPVRAAPEVKPLPDARPTATAQEAFAAICREGVVVDSRRVPAWLGQSYLGDNCVAPRPPAVIDGSKASREEIVAGMEAAKRYSAAADTFQKCVGDFVAARNAGGGKRLTSAQTIIQNYRVQVSQKNKETTTNQMHMAIMAFNKYGSDCPM
jgi:hypothetical protein